MTLKYGKTNRPTNIDHFLTSKFDNKSIYFNTKQPNGTKFVLLNAMPRFCRFVRWARPTRTWRPLPFKKPI